MKIPLTLVTLVCEGLLKEQISSLLRRHHATGFTITRTDGEGSRGVRARDWEGPSLKFESIVSATAADAILAEVSEVYFESYAVIAWLTPVSVLRGEKFVSGTGPNEGTR